MDIPTLERRRAGHKGQLTKIEGTIAKHEAKTTLLDREEVIGILKSLESIDMKTKEISEQIYSLCDTDPLMTKAIDDADDMDMRLIRTIGRLQSIFKSFAVAQPSHHQDNIKLPRIELPSFDGKFENWQSFQDLFLATVESNKSLSGAQKLQYLKGCVKGEPSNLIQSFTVTDTHYREAWSLLSDRYDNKREIANALIKRIFSQASLKFESASGLQRLLDVSVESIRSLKVLGRPTEHWDDIIIFIIVDKMDPESRKEWAKSLTGTDLPTFDDLQEFLEKHIRGLQAGSVSSSHQVKERRPASSSSHHVTSSPVVDTTCPMCKQAHHLYQCQAFHSLSIEERSKRVRSSALCFNCFKGHSVKDCSSNSTCRKCGKRHHTLLHFENRRPTPITRIETSASHHNALQPRSQPQQPMMTLMKTALISVQDNAGKSFVCRAFLDDGSESSFISEECVSSLGLRKEKTNIQITGLASSSIGSAKFKVNLNLSSVSQSASFNVDAVVVPKVTAPMPRYPIDISSFSYLRGLQLADPNFHETSKIDILLGADIVASLTRPGLKNGPKNTPIAQNTVLGWVLSGKTLVKSPDEVNVHHLTIEQGLQRFWEIEELPSIRHYTEEEKFCEQHFLSNFSRDVNSGRYSVKLPFKSNVSKLGSSREQAVRRLMSLERRFIKYPNYKDDYIKFMREYEQLGHMIQIPKDKINANTGFYLPHHFVLKLSSSTTKLRVVFDGSAKSSSGLSLNNALMIGPTIQDDLCTLLMRFRTYPIALKADIAKMYRQFRVKEEDMEFQKILWRESSNHPIHEYWLKTVTYGTAAASFEATRALKQLGEDEKTRFPLASHAIINDMYVDDLISGANTKEEAIILHQQIVDLVKSGGMEIRQWMTNDKDVFQAIAPELREEKDLLELDHSSSVPALGVHWKPSTDTFSFLINQPSITTTITKRQLLAELAKVFDPLGLLSPVTINAKMMFQQLWKESLHWDDPISEEMQRKWSHYQQQLSNLMKLAIPRAISLPNAQNYQLHGFCDSSEQAYGAAVYLKSTTKDGQVKVELVAAKTKVAPVKQQSLPRLELCGAVMLTDLLTIVQKACKLNCSITAWTDSTTVLKWLTHFPGKWKTFVANRVAKIQEETSITKWSHVRSEDNPADCASRGIIANELLIHPLWWNGPSWLRSGEYPKPVTVSQTHADVEEKTIKVSSCHISLCDSTIAKFSSLNRLLIFITTIRRFVHNHKKAQIDKQFGPPHPVELQTSLNVLIKSVQQEEFGKDIKQLSSSKPISSTSRLLQLNPFIDKDGLLRVGGRLHHSQLTEEQKHPIILPHSNHLVTLIIRQCHYQTLHGGCQLVQSTLARKYWILRGRDTIRHLIRKCVTCKRHQAVSSQQLMGNLPVFRVTPSRPFLNTGVDYAGPYLVLKAKGRGEKTLKCWFAILVCLSTKAVHLETVTEMTSDAFVACYKRFVARRGIPAHMFSDCGTNFVGAEKELTSDVSTNFHNQDVKLKLAEQGTTWSFNSPHSPHQGGVWEAGVKSVKFHLRRVMGTSHLTLEEFGTLLCCVEGILNSRPLCALSSDPTNCDALTPGHFLIGGPINAVPEQDLADININRLSRWQKVQQLHQHFWKRWRGEYLSSLQQRFKWTQKRANLQVGDLVVLHDDLLPPAKWKLGRVIGVKTGADSLVRVVTIKTATGQTERSIAKLSPLISNSNDSN